MGRKKIPMIYIEDDRKRASTFEKRRIGLFKKASELNRLCGVDISVTIVNKHQVYKFSEGLDKVSNHFHVNMSEKLEENFTNDSLTDFIKKKSQRITTNVDSDSVDRESVGEHNNISTEDEEDPEFIHELEVNNLLESYHNLQPEISPIKGAQFELLPERSKPRSGQDCVTRPLVFGCAPTHEKSAVGLKTPLYSQSFTTASTYNPMDLVKEHNRQPQLDLHYIDELLPTFSTNSIYSLPDDIPTNPRWLSHKSTNPQHSQLRFDFNLNDKNYLETPDLNITHLQSHSNANLPNFHDFQDDPKSKRIKFSSDSGNLTYFQQNMSS